MTFDQELGVRLARLRSERRLTLEEVGKRIGVTREAVYRWEAGIRQLKAQRIRDLAKLYGVSADFLLGMEGRR